MAGCVGKVGSNGSGFPGVWEYRGPMTDPPDDRRAMSSSRTIQPRKVSLFSNNSFPMWKYCDPCPENMNTVSDAGTKDPFLTVFKSTGAGVLILPRRTAELANSKSPARDAS